MTTFNTDMSPRSTRALRIVGWLSAILLLSLPAIAMQFTTEVRWSPGDFLFAALALGTVGCLLELTARSSANVAFRVGAGVAVLTGLLTVWISFAVGIIGEPDDPRNLVYLAVCTTATAGATVAWGRADALARAAFATAVLQALIMLAHVVDGVRPAMLIDGFFVLTWLVASASFALAARQSSSDTE